MKESEPSDCMYHTNKDVQPSAKIEWLDTTKAFQSFFFIFLVLANIKKEKRGK